MNVHEIAQEMLNYLNERGQYYSFLDWAENRGFDVEELENDLEKIEGYVG